MALGVQTCRVKAGAAILAWRPLEDGLVSLRALRMAPARMGQTGPHRAGLRPMPGRRAPAPPSADGLVSEGFKGD